MFDAHGNITFTGIMSIIYWIGGSIMNGIIAHAKGRSVPASVVISIFLSPVLPYLYLLAVPKHECPDSKK